MTARVVAAFFASGGWNAGTPVAIASVPVSATAPAAKARRTRIAVSGSTVLPICSSSCGPYVAPSPSTTIRNTPTAIISRADPTNR